MRSHQLLAKVSLADKWRPSNGAVWAVRSRESVRGWVLVERRPGPGWQHSREDAGRVVGVDGREGSEEPGMHPSHTEWGELVLTSAPSI